MLLDVIIPAYNEEGNINALYDSLCEALSDIRFNLIFVDDGSNDNTYKELVDLYKKDKKHVQVISFSRNFGKDAAMYAGLKASKAKYACIIDADLQQSPTLVRDMLKFLEENEEYDEVAMVNQYTHESIFQKIFKRVFYKVMMKSTKQEYVAGASDFRLFRKNVVKALVTMKENNRFTKGLFSWIGFKIHYMKYTPDKRHSGKSKFNFTKQISYAIDGLMNFSTSILNGAIVLGTICTTVAFIYFIYIFIKTLVLGKDMPGYASLACLILFFGGIIIAFQGLLAKYIAKVYMQAKERPIYIEKATLGFDEDIL